MIGIASILLITKEMDKKAIIKKDKNTIPKDLKFDLRFKICLVDIIKAAKIQNWVKKIIGIINSGVTAKNLNKPGAMCEIRPSTRFSTNTSSHLNFVFLTRLRKARSTHAFATQPAKAARMTESQRRSAVARKRAKPQGVGGKPTNVKTFA